MISSADTRKEVYHHFRPETAIDGNPYSATSQEKTRSTLHTESRDLLEQIRATIKRKSRTAAEYRHGRIGSHTALFASCTRRTSTKMSVSDES